MSQNVSGNDNQIIYYSRYNQVDKYEIYDHDTNIVFSGLTFLVGNGGKISHSGITYNFDSNNYYTYKSYYTYDSGLTYFICNQTRLKSTYELPVSNSFKEIIKPKNTFKNGKR